MSFISLILISISLSIDIFIITILEGMTMQNLKKIYMCKVALIFGSFAAFTLYIGWRVGETFFKNFSKYNYIITAAILFTVGIKMLYDSWKGQEENEKVNM